MSNARKISLDSFISMAEGIVIGAQETIDASAKALVENPSYTLEWGERIFKAAALVDVWSPMLKTAKETRDEGGDADAYLTAIKGGLLERVVRMAQSPKRSTSQCSNLMEQERLVVFADVAERLRAPYMHNLEVDA